MIYRIEPTENGLLVHGPSRGPSTLRPLGDEQFGGDSLELQFRRLQGRQMTGFDLDGNRVRGDRVRAP